MPYSPTDEKQKAKQQKQCTVHVQEPFPKETRELWKWKELLVLHKSITHVYHTPKDSSKNGYGAAPPFSSLGHWKMLHGAADKAADVSTDKLPQPKQAWSE